MIRNIVFDMGGVLIRFDVNHYIACFADGPEDQELLRREVFRSVEWVRLDRGAITDAQATESICKRLPEHLHPAVSAIFKNWHQDIPPLDGIYDLVGDLKEAGYGIYLLSNTSTRYHEFRRNIPALRFFDGEFISADYGVLKPEQEIYERFFQAFSLEPSGCLFIDDNAPNIEASIRAGMDGIVYHGDADDLRRKLREKGVSC